MGKARDRRGTESLEPEGVQGGIELMNSWFGDETPFFLDIVGEGLEEGDRAIETSSTLEYLYDIPTALGYPRNERASHISERSCFNCGSTFHSLHACPDPHDSIRIALAREKFKERRRFPSALGIGIRDWYEGKDTALRWVDEFIPGKITVPELRGALGLEDDELRIGLEADEVWAIREQQRREDELPWYAGCDEGCDGGMLKWGYPPGYYSVDDPFEAMRCRVFEIFDPPTTTLFPLQEASDTTQTNPESVTVHAKADPPRDEAFISLFPDIDHDGQRGIQRDLAEFMQLDASKPRSGGNASSFGNPPIKQREHDPGSSSVSSSDKTVISPIPPNIEPRRWAIYPTTLFQWGVLPVSQVTRPLPSSGTPSIITRISSTTSNTASQSTFTPARAALWDRIIKGLATTTSTEPKIHPWRRPEAWLSQSQSLLYQTSLPYCSFNSQLAFHSSGTLTYTPFDGKDGVMAKRELKAANDTDSVDMDMSE